MTKVQFVEAQGATHVRTAFISDRILMQFQSWLKNWWDTSCMLCHFKCCVASIHLAWLSTKLNLN